MDTIKLNTYGNILTDENLASRLASDDYKDGVEFDFDGVLTMTTKFSEILFGTLYSRLGSVNYFERIKKKGVNEDLNILIRMGISNSLKK